MSETQSASHLSTIEKEYPEQPEQEQTSSILLYSNSSLEPRSYRTISQCSQIDVQSNRSLTPTILSTDDTIVRRGDGAIKISDPKKTPIVNGREEGMLDMTDNLASLGLEGTSSSHNKHSIVEEEKGVKLCCFGWFQRREKRQEKREGRLEI
ncbi:predicted protein [Chaetoceros tenuissimus]|uniref:Uncharacterized protein n=1 Tax=Chaetoceros tenuissimus TaxID=426638 RepID=A0AAD3CER7_9STRA|nr:predicted protein [Chaetoceros tenuissimus]